MIELYHASPSIYGRKVLTALMEKNLDYEIKTMSFATQDHLKEDYLKLNPNGEIPTLIDDGRVIYESTAIIEYLEDEYPEPPLMPQEPFERAQVRMIEDFCDLHLNRTIAGFAVKKFVRHEEITAPEKERLAGLFKRIETYLGNAEFLAGRFSLADCAFMPAVPSVEWLGISDVLDGLNAAMKTYLQRLKARPGYAGASYNPAKLAS